MRLCLLIRIWTTPISRWTFHTLPSNSVIYWHFEFPQAPHKQKKISMVILWPTSIYISYWNCICSLCTTIQSSQWNSHQCLASNKVYPQLHQGMMVAHFSQYVLPLHYWTIDPKFPHPNFHFWLNVLWIHMYHPILLSFLCNCGDVPK